MARARRLLQRTHVTWWGGALLLVASVVLVVRALDVEALRRTFQELVERPAALTAALVAYAGAFAVRAGLWRRVVPGLSLGHAAAALHVSLAGNHVLPLRLGEA